MKLTNIKDAVCNSTWVFFYYPVNLPVQHSVHPSVYDSISDSIRWYVANSVWDLESKLTVFR